MPSSALRSVAYVTAIAVAVSTFIGPAATAGGTYPAAVKLISGAVAMAGSLYLTRAIGLTLLRSGGNAAFRALYVTATALGGLGMAEASSALCPGNIGYALAAYCVVSIVSGALWVRFYGAAC